MDNCQFSMKASATGPGLHLRVCLNGQELFNNSLNDSAIITGTFTYTNNDAHILSIEMSKKLQEYTILNDSGEIVSDRLIEITEVTIDDIDVTSLFYTHSTYTHDFNGTGSSITQQFYRYMGCNGVVCLEFAGPVYNWMLESM